MKTSFDSKSYECLPRLSLGSRGRHFNHAGLVLAFKTMGVRHPLLLTQAMSCKPNAYHHKKKHAPTYLLTLTFILSAIALL